MSSPERPTMSTATLQSRTPTIEQRREAAARAVTETEGIVADLSGSVGKALALLASFSHDRPSMGLSELARRSGLSKSTAHRLLALLVSWSILTREGTEYSPGPRLAELAVLQMSASHRRLKDTALPYLQDLYEATHETVHLAVLERTDVLYLEKLYGHNRVKSPSRVGSRLPAAFSALGKAMLAHSDSETVRTAAGRLRRLTPHSLATPTKLVAELELVREHGVSFDRQETALGLVCVGAPLLDWSGSVIGAVSVSGPANRFRPGYHAATVRRAAAGLIREYQRAS